MCVSTPLMLSRPTKCKWAQCAIIIDAEPSEAGTTLPELVAVILRTLDLTGRPWPTSMVFRVSPRVT